MHDFAPEGDDDVTLGSEHLIQSIQSYADAVAHVRRGGRIELLSGELDDAERVASTVALITAAVERLGVSADNGPLDTIMLQFRERVLMVASTARGLVVVVARSKVQPGLLLSHLRQLVTSVQAEHVHEGTETVAEAS